MTATILTINAKSSKLTSSYNNSQSDRLVARLIHQSNNNNNSNNSNDNIISPNHQHHHRNRKLYNHNQQSIPLGPTHPPSLNRQPQTKKPSFLAPALLTPKPKPKPTPSPSIELWAGLSQKIVIPPSPVDQQPIRHPTSSIPPPPSSSPSLTAVAPSTRSAPGAPPPILFPLYSTQLLSFPTTSTVPPFAFDFPSPAPARRSPPPYPGPRPVASIRPPSRSQSHPHPESRRLAVCQHQRPQLRSQSYAFRPLHPLLIPPLTPSRRKRGAPLPLAQSIRSKKIKLAHPFFRSPRLFYPVDWPDDHPIQQLTSSGISQKQYLIYRAMQCPKWLHTSAAAEGHTSKMCPKEAHFTGTSRNWAVLPDSKPSSFSPSLNVPSPRSPTTRCAPPATSPRATPPTDHLAAPLKAQLLAVLRMRSSLQPGEAALRLRKWVIWNSWTRGQAQRHFYPINNTACVNFLPMSHSRTSTLAESSSDEWTGDEMFDENGDLVCDDEDLDGSEEMNENSHSTPLSVAKSAGTADLGSKETSKNQGITRSNIPPRIITSKYPTNLTPPSSPESQRHRDGENKSDNLSCNVTVDVANRLGQIKVSKADQRPLTPPPSPPNQIRK